MFIARQPIFTRAMKVYGYELLYRDSETATTFNHSSAEQSTATVLSGLFELGIDNISNNKKSFINFSYDFLFSDSMELIEPDNLIIEVLEHTIIDDKLINKLTELNEKGYKIALDDFVEDYETFPLIPISDIIKYDIMATPLHTIKVEVRRALMDGKKILAEKVETKEEYELAKKMGFHFYQGYFFEKPNIIGKSFNKKSPKLSYIEIMNELQSSEPSFDRLTNIIKNDVNLSYRLLQSSRQKESDSDDFIDSIKKSLVFMGFKQVKRWIDVLMLRELATDKPLELTRQSLVRAHFGELIARHSKFKSKSNEIYGMFLFSTLDALLDQTMEKALEDVPLTNDVKKALIYKKGSLAAILQLVYSYEKGDWENVNKLSHRINFDEKDISQYYMDSIGYCTLVMNDAYNNL